MSFVYLSSASCSRNRLPRGLAAAGPRFADSCCRTNSSVASSRRSRRCSRSWAGYRKREKNKNVLKRPQKSKKCKQNKKKILTLVIPNDPALGKSLDNHTMLFVGGLQLRSLSRLEPVSRCDCVHSGSDFLPAILPTWKRQWRHEGKPCPKHT